MAALPQQKGGFMKVLLVEHSAIIQERLKAMFSEVLEVENINQAQYSLEAMELLRC